MHGQVFTRSKLLEETTFAKGEGDEMANVLDEITLQRIYLLFSDIKVANDV